jgi:hypothetical protein
VSMTSRDINKRKYKDRVQRDFMGDVRSGVNGTACFCMIEIRFEGSWGSGELAVALARFWRP